MTAGNAEKVGRPERRRRADERPLWQRRLIIVLAHQAPVCFAVGIALLVPLALAVWDAQGMPPWSEVRAFVFPAGLALFIGGLLHFRRPVVSSLPSLEALLITTAAWLTAAFLGALPFVLLLGTPAVDAVFESISGFTTAGTTMLTQLDSMPRSILLWRAIMQWMGGLGILLIVLLLTQTPGNPAFSLLSAEGVKVSSGRLSLNFRRGAYRFALIYTVLTVALVALLLFLGMPVFDSVAQSLTTISTGGFSPHDESIAFYRHRPGLFPNFAAIELVLIFFMLAGAINFYVHYRIARGDLRALWQGAEMRLLWVIVAVATAIVTLDALRHIGPGASDWLLRSGFEVVSLVSTTGFETTATGSFPRLSRELFMLLMVIGGCAGSTAGGIKIMRLAILSVFLRHEIRLLRLPTRAIDLPQLDGMTVSNKAFRQAAFILLLWLGYVAVTGFVLSGLAPELTLSEAYAAALAAIGVFGPSFASVQQIIALPDPAKLLLMVGMLAGRLEILPLLVFVNLAAWRR